MSSSYKHSHSFIIPQRNIHSSVFSPCVSHALSIEAYLNYLNTMNRSSNNETPHCIFLILVILSSPWIKSHQPCGLIIPNHQNWSQKVFNRINVGEHKSLKPQTQRLYCALMKCVVRNIYTNNLHT